MADETARVVEALARSLSPDPLLARTLGSILAPECGAVTVGLGGVVLLAGTAMAALVEGERVVLRQVGFPIESPDVSRPLASPGPFVAEVGPVPDDWPGMAWQLLAADAAGAAEGLADLVPGDATAYVHRLRLDARLLRAAR